VRRQHQPGSPDSCFRLTLRQPPSGATRRTPPPSEAFCFRVYTERQVILVWRRSRSPSGRHRDLGTCSRGARPHNQDWPHYARHVGFFQRRPVFYDPCAIHRKNISRAIGSLLLPPIPLPTEGACIVEFGAGFTSCEPRVALYRKVTHSRNGLAAIVVQKDA
jgi:hypothetical protein